MIFPATRGLQVYKKQNNTINSWVFFFFSPSNSADKAKTEEGFAYFVQWDSSNVE